MKKLLLSLVIAVIAVLGLTACGDSGFKVGLICLHDENSTYDKNFIDAFKAACEATGAKAVIKTNVDEKAVCYESAAELVDSGCKLVFADSFGHEDFLIQAAQEFKDVEFCHATGTQAHTKKLANFHNAFASIYEGRYLAGVAAGLKLQAMMAADANVKPVVGYIGAYTYAEVISGYTSWFLGVQSIVPTATMKVQFTGSWYDETLEKEAAENLISQGCVLISQHADSWGAPKACEKAGVPNVSYNGSTASQCPNTFIVSSRINWQPYFEYIINQTKAGKAIEADWSQGLGTTLTDGAVCLTELGNAAVEGTQAKLDEVAAKLKDGSLKVFDLSKFTVNGVAVADDFMANVDTDPEYAADTVVIKTTAAGVKYFAESEFRSAPYFELQIDGIELLNQKF